MDYLSTTELKTDSHGLLVLKDGFSTFCALRPCAKFDAANVETAVLEWAAIFGMPRLIVTDSGTHFKCKLIYALALRMRSLHHCTAPYAHWTHGASERLNRTILHVFCVLMAETATHYKEWKPLLPP